MLERIPKIIWRPVLTHLCSVKEKEKQITGAEIFVIPRDIKVSFIYKMWAVRSSIWVDLHIFSYFVKEKEKQICRFQGNMEYNY